jgi:O-succinylbenzoic acid--CoA ligase
MRRLQVVAPTAGPELYGALRVAVEGTGPAVFPGTPYAGLRPEEGVPDDVCLVVPTSGSTGEPKGVELTASCLAASADATATRLGGSGRWWLTLPVTHIAGLQVVLRSGYDPSPDPEGCRFTSLVPTQLSRMLDDPRLPRLDAVLLGGAAAPPALLEAARDRGINVVTTYGMSESSGGCVYDGQPLDGVTVDVSERIVLSGPVVARGYRFGEPFAGRFETSDVGSWDGDRLIVLGRADDLINTGGEKVAPLAVEHALSGHPAVVEVAVVGQPDPEWGSRVVAFAVLRAPLSLDDARDWVASRVSRVAAPRELRVVDALPLLPGGKVDRLRLTTS